MLKRTSFLLVLTVGLILVLQSPASAHVKWFLHEAEAKLLHQPKPDLFTKLQWLNLLVAFMGVNALLVAKIVDKHFSDNETVQKMLWYWQKRQSSVSLVIGTFTGCSLIKCALDMTYFVPNMHLHSCCSWVAQVEALIGIGLVLGFLSRACGAAMLFMLLWGLVKFSLADCADLIPMYGLASYLLIVGRGKWSVDGLLKISHDVSSNIFGLGMTLVRGGIGVGLIGLGLDEKLVNPQLSLYLLHQQPNLNVFRTIGFGDDFFVLCAGVSEVVLGVMLTIGILPRLSMIVLAVLFTMTTALFGATEAFGHLPYYGIVLAIIANPGGTISFTDIQRNAVNCIEAVNQHYRLIVAYAHDHA